jgi:hypothetical protein
MHVTISLSDKPFEALRALIKSRWITMGKSFSMKENGPLYSGSSDELIDLGLANYMWLQRVAQRATTRGCETNDVDPRPIGIVLEELLAEIAETEVD